MVLGTGMKPTRILLTGTGFVGKAIADALVEADFEVLLPTAIFSFASRLVRNFSRLIQLIAKQIGVVN